MFIVSIPVIVPLAGVTLGVLGAGVLAMLAVYLLTRWLLAEL